MSVSDSLHGHHVRANQGSLKEKTMGAPLCVVQVKEAKPVFAGEPWYVTGAVEVDGNPVAWPRESRGDGVHGHSVHDHVVVKVEREGGQVVGTTGRGDGIGAGDRVGGVVEFHVQKAVGDVGILIPCAKRQGFRGHQPGHGCLEMAAAQVLAFVVEARIGRIRFRDTVGG